jgi:hypothetical protein
MIQIYTNHIQILWIKWGLSLDSLQKNKEVEVWIALFDLDQAAFSDRDGHARCSTSECDESVATGMEQSQNESSRTC